MFKAFFPDRYIVSSYKIDYEGLFEKGYRGLIFDIDNTLVPHGFPADDRSIRLMKRLKDIGYQVLFLSNNKEGRVKMFNDAVDCMYIYKAGKPSRKGFGEAMDKMGCTRENTILIGDQLFTDVWGAKRSGIMSILVAPIDKKEEFQIVLKRIAERIILRAYRNYCKKEGKVFLEDGE
ncbi:MAG: YqeG family HAD IIIA-type phosphatase [Lachnospiraceae bacterium]|nr:YqeG family HAD IIIA-type phosphatase [Lachnospiraceae bacterium]